MPAPDLCFVLAPAQNHFFVEVVDALTRELAELGVRATVSRDGFPAEREGLVYVLVPPHEFRGLAPRAHWPTSRQLERTIFYCFEQPGTRFFDDDVRMGRGPVGAVVDLNAISVREHRRRGVRAHHAPIGWTATWSAVDPLAVAGPSAPVRDIDLIHLGIYSPRRGRALARSAERLSRWRTALVLGDDHGPNAVSQANFTIDEDKWDLLARSRVLLNVHLGERPYFEWLRVVQAICNGVAVVSEHSTGTAPLRAGQHFLSGRADELVAVAEPLLEDERRRAELARGAAELLRERQPLSRSAELLAELAAGIAARPLGPRACQGALMLGASGDPGVEQAAAIARTVALRGGDPAPTAPDPRDDAPGFDDAVVPWPDYGGGVAPASPAPGGQGALARPAVPVARALSASPMDAGDDELVLLGDPTVTVDARALDRLERALREDGTAAFAWGMVAFDATADDDPGLRNVFPWQPWRLQRGDRCIGRPVLWRAAALRELDDPGGEPGDDLALYRRAAERGLHGIHLPEIVARGARPPR